MNALDTLDQSSVYFPWQRLQWQQLQQAQLPHAILLHGMAGLGKTHFAKLLAKKLLCRDAHQPEQLPCGQCRSCHLWTTQTHPDYLEVMPEETGKAIKIDAIRELTQRMTQTGQISERRVVLLTPAEAMNHAAANALLKTLEEPPENVFLVLVTHQRHELLATIRSRCHQVGFLPSFSHETQQWLEQWVSDPASCSQALKLAQGKPLNAYQALLNPNADNSVDKLKQLIAILNQDVDIPSVAEDWNKDALGVVVTQLQTWVSDGIRYKILASKEAIEQAHLSHLIIHLTEKLSLTQLNHYYQFLTQQKQQVSRGISFNSQLFIEQLLSPLQHTEVPL